MIAPRAAFVPYTFRRQGLRARALNERGLAAAHGQIDADAFEAAWAEGRSLTLEEVVAEALAENV